MKASFEPLLHSGDRLLISQRIELPRFDHPYHFHPEVEITFISAGSGTLVVGDQVGSFQVGGLYLLGPDLPHVFRDTARPKRGACAEVLQFPAGLVGGLFAGKSEVRGLAWLLERSRRGMVFGGVVPAKALRLLRRIRLADGAGRLAAFFELAELLVTAPEVRLLASAEYSPLSCLVTGSERIHRACGMVLEEFREEIRHKDISRRIHMSPAAFSRLFRRTTRKTFTEFVTEVRLGHACRLLRESDKTVVEIAFASGFNNLANFNRRFRDRHGRTPREYRAGFGSATA